MTIVTINERTTMNKGVQKSRSSLWFLLATGPTLKKHCGSAPALPKHLRLKVYICVS